MCVSILLYELSCVVIHSPICCYYFYTLFIYVCLLVVKMLCPTRL